MSSPIERMSDRLKRYLTIFSHKVESKEQKSVIKLTSRRRMFPADLNITVAETARGTGIAISENKKWKCKSNYIHRSCNVTIMKKVFCKRRSKEYEQRGYN